MVMRVTNQMLQRNVLSNIFRITEDLFKAQEEIASGKRINKPSDDPSGIRDALGLRTGISQSNQFVRNIDNNRILIQSGDSALEAIGVGLIRSKELAIGALGGTSTATTRGFAAAEIDKIISQVFQSANTQVRNHYIFSGTKTRTQPFLNTASGAVYQGNTENFRIGIDKSMSIEVTLPGSEVLATDLDPALATDTALANLNGGAGVTAGSFTITDRGGNSAAIAVASGQTVGNVINAINAAGLQVTASLNSKQNGIVLQDTSAVITQNLVVTEVSGGRTALDLGLLGQRDGNLQGTDLNPVMTAATRLSQLNGGLGLTLGSISVVNGSASGAISLSTATTIGDVINLINASAFNVTASIKSGANGLRVDSNNAATVAVVGNLGLDPTSESLGIGGGRNVIDTLIKLRDALEKDDTAAILALLNNLDNGQDSVNESRAILGAILRRMESNNNTHEKSVVDQAEQMANIEDTDLAKKASDLAAMELALEATLNTTARILQPSLLDFLT